MLIQVSMLQHAQLVFVALYVLHCQMHGSGFGPTFVATCSFWSSGVLQAASSSRHPYALAAHTVSWHHHRRHLQGKLHHLAALSLRLCLDFCNLMLILITLSLQCFLHLRHIEVQPTACNHLQDNMSLLYV